MSKTMTANETNYTCKRNLLLSILFILVISVNVRAEIVTEKDSIEIMKIWDQGQHNAFTDLVRFKNKFYCSFREGESHVGSNEKNGGNIRILVSRDAKKWESVALLHIAGLDLRDPKLSVTPDGKIMVIMAGAIFKDGVAHEMYPMVSFSDKNGVAFSRPEKSALDPSITPSKDWIWRVTWHNGVGYGMNYQLKENGRNRSILSEDAWLLYLMKTKDGKYFENVSRLNVKRLPNESTIRFDEKNKAYVLIRKEEGDKMGVLAESAFPYTNWTFNKLGFRLGGPNFLIFNKDRLIIGTRIYEPETSTRILVTDRKGNIQKSVALPGGGDQSYPGMVMHDRHLWVSYYSSHEGKTSIYLAKIPLGLLE